MIGAMNNIEWTMNTVRRGWASNVFDGIETMCQWEMWAEENNRMLQPIL